MTNYDLLDHDIRPLSDVRLPVMSSGRKKGREGQEENKEWKEETRGEGIREDRRRDEIGGSER